jgi:FkbM family methyltransferase
MTKLFPNSHGQLLQDVMCALVHSVKRQGYFVEVGVGDGEKFSNTLLLERELDWSGILAEPASMFHKSISDTRSAILDKRAVSDKSGNTVLFEQDDGMGELSGLAGQRSPRGQQNLSTYEVSTVRLDDLLAEHNAPDEIDYLSVDTEGSEISVLDGLSLSKRRISLVTIEHNYDRGRMRAYADLFESAGYRQLFPNLSSFDAWYVHNDLEWR